MQNIHFCAHSESEKYLQTKDNSNIYVKNLVKKPMALKKWFSTFHSLQYISWHTGLRLANKLATGCLPFHTGLGYAQQFNFKPQS